MKRFLLLPALALALVAASCGKEEPAGVDGDAVGGKVTLRVTVGEPATRATGSYDVNEKRVASVQVFCFDKTTGVREDYESATGQSLTLQITTGVKRIYALANCPDLSSVTTESALLAAATGFADNSTEGFVMVSPTGSAAEKVITESGDITLAVKRVVAKILVDKLTASFEQASLRPLDFVIKKIYLGNVAKSNNYGLTAMPNEYYQGSDNNGDKVNGMIAESGLSYNLKNGGTSDVKHGFYAYPNSSSNATKVIIEATLKGEDQIFAFNLPALERNKVYEVQNIMFTKPSTDDMFADVKVTITVADWDETTVLTDGFTY